jgi:hypothetical protein
MAAGPGLLFAAMAYGWGEEALATVESKPWRYQAQES